jgi:hypothetical protein
MKRARVERGEIRNRQDAAEVLERANRERLDAMLLRPGLLLRAIDHRGLAVLPGNGHRCLGMKCAVDRDARRNPDLSYLGGNLPDERARAGVGEMDASGSR